MRVATALLCAAAAAGAAELHAVANEPGLQGRCRSTVVEGEYLIKLKSGVGAEAHAALHQRLNALKSYQIGDRFRALHAALPTEQLQWTLAQPEVDYVAHNLLAHAAELPAHNASRRSCPDSQSEPLSWGQKRVTSASAADVADVFAHDKAWGSGVDVYVLDTGVRITHEEFGGRAKWGANFAGGAATDNNGHGTHCAGTIAGKTYGVAKGANIVAVKVLSDAGSGSTAGIISGIEWAVSEAKKTGRRGIGNMSLGGGYSRVFNDAVNAAAAEGFLFSNAAGNCGRDACSVSPASAEDGITVGSTELASQGGEQVDARSSFSNYGTCVEVFAPGSSIVSAYAGGDSSYATLSGTSMAAPHVAAVGAIVLQQQPQLTAAALSREITRTAIEGVIQGNIGSGSPNRMLHVQC